MRRTALAAALALSSAFAASSFAEVDVEVPATFKAKGTLDPGETERFRFHAEEGTVLTFAASAAKGSTLDFDIVLATGAGVPVPMPDEIVTDSGSKVAWKGFAVPATDDYQVVLAGTGSGGYALSLKSKVKAAWTSTLTFPGSPTVHFLFSAPKGSKVALSAKPTKGSPVVARFVSLDSGASSTDLSLAGKVSPTGQAATVGPLEDGGDYDLTVVNQAGAGDVQVSAKVKPPKSKPGKFDLRGVALGKPGGGETLVGRMLDAAGGSVAVGESASELFGAEIVLPAGALGAPTLVSIASSLPPPIGNPDDQAAGPAVLLGPSGLAFSAPAVVTLPVDLSRIPADTDISAVRILIVEDNGSSRIEFPTGFSSDTVTVETTGFSVCCPIIVSGPPALGISPGGDEFWFLQFSAQLFAGTTDSRGRTVTANIGECSFFGDGTFQFSQEQWGFTWQNQDSPPMSGNPISSGLTQFTQGDGATLSWAYDVSGRNIVLTGAPEALPTFRISRDGRYLAGRHDASTDPQAETQIGVRKNTAPLTVASLKGTWTCAYLEVDASQTSGTGAAESKVSRGTGTFVFDGTGGCSVSFTERKPHFDPSDSTFDQPLSNGSLPDATYSIDVDGTVLITSPPPEGDDSPVTLHAYPGAGLDVMLLTHTTFVNDSAMGMVLVRQGSGLSRASLSGAFHGTSFGADPQSYTTPTQGGVPIGDVTGRDEGVTCLFDGGATASFSFDAHEVRRESSLPDGVQASNGVDNLIVNVTVTSQGKFSAGDSGGKIVGAVSPDAQLLVAVTDVANAGGDYAIFFAFRAPPDKTP